MTATAAAAGYETLFDLQLPEGRCVGMRIDKLALNKRSSLPSSSNTTTSVFAPWVYECLHPQEVAYALGIASDTTQRSFVGGRLALRQAMGCKVPDDCIILKDIHGRPNIPPSFRGSISHKGNVAVALVAPVDTEDGQDGSSWAIGVDLEVRQKGHKDIARRILTATEKGTLGLLDGVNAEEEVLLRFSVKEALYKAMHPLICQFVGFQEAETQPLVNGTVKVMLNLTSAAHNDFGSVSANWKALDDYFLTSARVRLKPGVRSRTNRQNDECKM